MYAVDPQSSGVPYSANVSSKEPQTPRGRATRDRILHAAMNEIREYGVAAMTLDDVERRAGVGRSQLYHYFDSRDGLVRAVVDSTIDAVLGHSSAMSDVLTTRAGIEAWFVRAEAACRSTGGVGGCPLGSLVGQLAESDEPTRLALADAFERWQAPLATGLRHLRDMGSIQENVDVDRLADAIMAALQGGLLLAQIRRDPEQLRHAFDGARAALDAAAA